MRAIRKGKKKAGQSAARRAEVRPNLLVTLRNSTGAKQTYAQHGCPSARTQLKRRFPASCYSSLKLSPQPKIAASQKIPRDQDLGSIEDAAAQLSDPKPDPISYRMASLRGSMSFTHLPDGDGIVTAALRVVQGYFTSQALNRATCHFLTTHAGRATARRTSN
jgi:hypothetical protein